MSDYNEMIERVARHLANLEEGQPWFTNVELGGSFTGTRDVEYRDGMRAEAQEILDVAGGVLIPKPVDKDRLADVVEASHSDWTYMFESHQLHPHSNPDPGPLADFIASDLAEYLDEGEISNG